MSNVTKVDRKSKIFTRKLSQSNWKAISKQKWREDTPHLVTPYEEGWKKLVDRRIVLETDTGGQVEHTKVLRKQCLRNSAKSVSNLGIMIISNTVHFSV